MNFLEPSSFGFTIYSKSGCYNCTKVKELLNKNNYKYLIIDCDDYIIENKEEFILFLKNKIKESTEIKEIKVIFPFVFFDKKFIDGYNEIQNLLEKNKSFDMNEEF